jgi:hypothetical protein
MPDPGITASISIGLPPQSGVQVICWRQFGTCFWTSPGLGWSDEGRLSDAPSVGRPGPAPVETVPAPAAIVGARDAPSVLLPFR